MFPHCERLCSAWPCQGQRSKFRGTEANFGSGLAEENSSCLHETRVPSTCGRESGGKTAALHIAWACRGVVASCGMAARGTLCAVTDSDDSSRGNSRATGQNGCPTVKLDPLRLH